MEIVIVELDSGAEVAGAELVGGMDLGSAPAGGWNAAAMRGASMGRGRLWQGGVGKQRGQNPSCDRERERTTQSAREQRGRVDEDEPQSLDGKSHERRGRVNEDKPCPDGKLRDGRQSNII
jgi:hypothetical protein